MSVAPTKPESTGDHPSSNKILNWFELEKRGSTMRREVRGGLVTFFAMAYIIALNPIIIGTAEDMNGNLISGKPKYLDAAAQIIDNAAVSESVAMVAAVTALLAGVLTILMGVVGRFPIGVAAGLGLNSMLAYTVAPQMTWPEAMGLVVWSGILITLLVLTGFREAVFRAVPPSLRSAISVGIGLFVTLVGLANAGIIRSGSPLVSFGVDGTLMGWPILVFIVTLFLLIFLFVRNVPGAMLWAIFAGTFLAIVCEAVFNISAKEDNPAGWALNVPAFSGSFNLPDLSLLGRVDLIGGFGPDGHYTVATVVTALMLVFSLMLADFFDTMGTVVAIGAEGDMLNEKGEPPHLREILLVDSLGALFGGLGSGSSATSFVESTAGVASGARTGIASLVTGLAFLAALFLTPLVNMVPSEAVAPVLVIVGFLMMAQVGDIEWRDYEIAIPVFMTIIFMPFAYSITIGLGAGFITYVVIKVFVGKAREVHPLMWVVSALFVVYFTQGLLAAMIN